MLAIFTSCHIHNINVVFVCVFLFCDSYDIKLMYAVAASIPKDEKGVSYDLSRVTPNEQTKWNDGILSTLRLVVAQIKRVTTKKGSQYTQHAEWRVLQNVRCLEGHNGDFLVFFSRASPCDKTCANPNGNFKITDGLRNLFNTHVWGEKAFVFNELFKPGGQDTNPDTISSALTNIGAAIGHKNIFRCYKHNDGNFHCIRCFTVTKINRNCIS